MKKLKIILPIFLISLFFITNVKAMSTSDYNTSLMYSTEATEIMDTYSTKLEAIIDKLQTQDTWCRNTLCYKMSDGLYVPIIQLSTLSTNSVNVYISKVDTSSNNYYISTIFNENGTANDKQIYFQFGYLYFTFNFNGDTLTGTTYGGQGNKQYHYYYDSSFNPTLSNISKTISDYYYYPSFLNDNTNTTFKVWDTSLNNSYYSIPLKVGETVYTPPTTIPSKSFFSSFSPIIVPPNPTVCTRAKLLGTTLNVNSLIFRVRGTSSALDYADEGYFEMRSDSFTSSTDISSQFTLQYSWGDGSEIDENFDVDAYLTYDTDRNILRLDYSILNQDDLEASYDIRFNIVANASDGVDFLESELSIYSCPQNDIFTNVSYGYKDKTTGQNVSLDPTIFNALNNSNVDGTSSYLQELIENTIFNEDYGLSPIIQAPIRFISTFSSATCHNITFPLPKLGQVSIPCMSSIYSQYIPSVYVVLKLVINGILCYRMAVYVMFVIKSAQNPDEDKIEVLDL